MPPLNKPLTSCKTSMSACITKVLTVNWHKIMGYKRDIM